MTCKKIRTDDEWVRLEQYVHERADATFSHGLCEACYASLHLEERPILERSAEAGELLTRRPLTRGCRVCSQASLAPPDGPPAIPGACAGSVWYAEACGASGRPEMRPRWRAASLRRDETELLAFFDFPAEHWPHLRTGNVIESPFATVRLRQRVTKGAGFRQKGLVMAFQLLAMAERRWRESTRLGWSRWSGPA
jgi:hypothetical protein